MSGADLRRFIPLVRFPAIIMVIAGMLVWSEFGLSAVALSISQRLFFSGRLEESARFETEVNRFFEVSEQYAGGDPSVSLDDVNLALNLMWSRANVMNSTSFRQAIPAEQPDKTLISEIVTDLPAFDRALHQLEPGKPASFKAVEDLQRRYARRMAAFGEMAWNARQRRMAQSVETGLQSVGALRWIQTGFGVVSALAIAYVLAELVLSRRLNGRLNRMVEEKQRMLRTDQLTGISNRFHFEEVLEEHIRSGHANFSVIYFDLDGFKKVNDEHGHAAGDALLRHVAAALGSLIGEGDVAARFGGDEFAVLLRDGQSRAEAFANRALTQICEQNYSDLPKLTISASAGICHAADAEAGATQDMIKRRADVALYSAKAAGRNCVRSFLPEMNGEYERRRILEADIEKAVYQGEIHVAYQPVVRLADRKAHFVEALVRWNHPTLGPVDAMEIVESAVRRQTIQALTLAVIRQTLATYSRLRHANCAVPMSVNVTPALLAIPTFGPAVAALLYEYEMPAGALYLEITEDGELHDIEVMEDNLRVLRLAGALMAVDDFGRAFSNVSRLTSLDFRMLKLDRVLTEPVAYSGRARQIIESTDRMAIALGAETVCEGVESEEQALALANLGIEFGQGFHLGGPMPPDILQVFLAGNAQSGERQH